MYTSNNNSNSQAALQYDDDGFPLGKCVKKAMTKVRQGLDGQPNRGILILNTTTNQERWVSVPSNDPIARANNGTSLWFYGKGNRPSLELMSQHNANTTSGGQYQADRYSDYIEYMNQQPVAYSQQHRSLGESLDNSINERVSTPRTGFDTVATPTAPTINEEVLSAQCLALAQAVSLMRELCPYLDEQSIVKLAISASIAYQQQMKSMPF